MAKLTNAQLTYAVNRLNEIAKARVEAYTKTLPALPDEPARTEDTREEKKRVLFAGGQLEWDAEYLRSHTTGYRKENYNLDVDHATIKRTPAEKAALTKQKAVYEKAAAARKVLVDAFTATVNAEVQSIKDRLYLSDSAAALAAIEAFASGS